MNTKRYDNNRMMRPFLLVLMLISILALSGCSFTTGQQEEAKLRNLVSEVDGLINSGDYDNALIKAYEINYFSDDSIETKEKWDSVREEYIEKVKGIIKESSAAEREEKEKRIAELSTELEEQTPNTNEEGDFIVYSDYSVSDDESSTRSIPNDDNSSDMNTESDYQSRPIPGPAQEPLEGEIVYNQYW